MRTHGNPNLTDTQWCTSSYSNGNGGNSAFTAGVRAGDFD
jgi:hypothetical protein